MPDLVKLQTLWEMVTTQMKKRVTSIPLWRAMESAVVLDYEETTPGTLVLGLAGENYSLSGHLEVPENRNVIEQIFHQVTQRPLTFRLVECGSQEEWKVYKVQEERKRAAALAMASGRPRTEAPAPTVTPETQVAPSPESIQSMDNVLDRAYKIFTALPHRTLSQSRARFVREATQMLAESESQLAAAGLLGDALARAIDRAIDKIAVWGECDSTTVALEYLRHKDG